MNLNAIYKMFLCYYAANTSASKRWKQIVNNKINDIFATMLTLEGPHFQNYHSY